MQRTIAILALTLGFLAIFDVAVAGALAVMEGRGMLTSLVRYFEYGRSVPGKLEAWETAPGAPGNLLDVAWREAAVAHSAEEFASEPEVRDPVVRSYGMSFVDNILGAAEEIDPSRSYDNHSGPSAPPNFTYALFLDDRANRRPGDVAVLGILSSSIEGMAALSNRTWVFEQPAPFTSPVWWPDGEDGLRAVEPLVTTVAEQRSLSERPQAAAAWRAQMAAEDAFYSVPGFAASWLDVSPFARLVRRSLAVGQIARTETALLEGHGYPWDEVLRRMVANFAAVARADDQLPVVMLIQGRDPRDADVLKAVRPVLDAHEIPYLAIVEHWNPRDVSGFVGDGHYTHAVDAMFGAAFVDLIQQLAD